MCYSVILVGLLVYYTDYMEDGVVQGGPRWEINSKLIVSWLAPCETEQPEVRQQIKPRRVIARPAQTERQASPVLQTLSEYNLAMCNTWK